MNSDQIAMDAYQPPLVRTKERDNRVPEAPARATRYWTHAEVPGDIWYVLECAVHLPEREGLHVRRFVTSDFWQARELHRKTTYEWVALYACVRAPSDLARGHTFEQVIEVNRIGNRDDRLFLRLKSGLMLLTSGTTVCAERPMEIGKCVYP